MESSPLSSVAPVRPVAPYVGGKRNLSRIIIEQIGAFPHTTYAEPFVGMGGIFLRRDKRPKSEVINDISGDVATFFRVLQEHYPYLIDMLRFRVTSRAEFQRLLALPADQLTDLQRAVRFLYVQRLAFGGKVASRHFGVTHDLPARFNITQLEPMLADVHARLAGVIIECLPWEVFLARYDRPGTLFYLDPPYRGTEDTYGAGVFETGAFEMLAERLSGLRGRFIMSLNDHPDVRRIFARFPMQEVAVTYTVAEGNAVRAREVIIRDRR